MKKLFLIITTLAMPFCMAQELKDIKIEQPRKQAIAVELSKEKKELFNAIFFRFVNQLKSYPDRKGIDELLSDKVKTVVTDQVLKKLSDSIRLDKKLEIYKTGSQALIDGMDYPMIQYRYTDDKGSVPQWLITVLFEENGKILGVKPS